MADEKTFPTDEACALALLIREMTQTLQMELTGETETMLRNGVDDLVGRLAELGANWQRAQTETATPTETAVSPVLVETTPNTSSMPDTVPTPTSTDESVTP